MYKDEPEKSLYHISKDSRLLGKVVNVGQGYVSYIFDNRKLPRAIILNKTFGKNEQREAHIWMYDHLDCTVFTLLESKVKLG